MYESGIWKRSFADIIQNICSWKCRKFHRKAPVLVSLFNKDVVFRSLGLQLYLGLLHRCFPLKFAKFLTALYRALPVSASGIYVYFHTAFSLRGQSPFCYPRKMAGESREWFIDKIKMRKHVDLNSIENYIRNKTYPEKIKYQGQKANFRKTRASTFQLLMDI